MPEGEYLVPIGVADVKREGTDVTIVAWSKMANVALKAADTLAAEGVSCEVIDPRTLRPLDEAPIIASVQKTNRCVVVEEGWEYAGHRRAARLHHPPRRVQRPGRAGDAGDGRRRADAVREEPGTHGHALRRPRGAGGEGSALHRLVRIGLPDSGLRHPGPDLLILTSDF